MLLEKLNRIYQESKNRNLEKMTKIRTLTIRNLAFYFVGLVKKYYDKETLVSEEIMMKLSGLLKVLKKNGYTDKDVFLWIREIVLSWERFAGLEVRTDKGKIYKLDYLPNLLDIIYCKNFFLNEVKIRS